MVVVVVPTLLDDPLMALLIVLLLGVLDLLSRALVCFLHSSNMALLSFFGELVVSLSSAVGRSMGPPNETRRRVPGEQLRMFKRGDVESLRTAPPRDMRRLLVMVVVLLLPYFLDQSHWKSVLGSNNG